MTRIALGAFMQESHSFAPAKSGWASFASGYIYRHEELLTRLADTSSEIAGALAEAERQDSAVVPLLACSAVSGGPLEAAVFDSLLSEMVAALRSALPVDGVLLILHGGMVAEHADDATGHILASVRDLVGSAVPIAITLDLHANVTHTIVQAADIVVGYHTFPHIDMFETGTRAMELLCAHIAGRIRPVMALKRLPMILPGENGVTTGGPYGEVMAEAVALEAHARILSASVFSVQPWLDVADVGCSVVVIADGDAELAGREAEKLADAFWLRRRAFDVHLVPLDEAIQRAVKATKGPFVISDSADAPSSGAPGDSTVVLKALLDADVSVMSLLNIVDPEAVAASIEAGVGSQVTLKVGAKYSQLFYEPVHVTGRVRLISDGKLRFKGAGFQGVEFNRGRTVVLQMGAIFLEIMEQAVFQWDPELYRSVGLEPEDARIVVVKSPAGFRAAYTPFAHEILVIDAPGVCSPVLNSFPWKHLKRPCFPFDDVADWRSSSLESDVGRENGLSGKTGL